MKKNDSVKQIEEEAVFGIVPVLTKEKQYGFLEAFLFLSSYGIATWNYTQGAYLATITSFKGILLTSLLGSVFMMAIFELPVILATRYGIDIWIWLKSVLGHTGVKIATVLVVLLNFPWHSVCAQLFASSMENLIGLSGVSVSSSTFLNIFFILVCVALGAWIACRGINSITWTTKILTPLLILVGVVVLVVGFTSAPISAIVNYVPPAVQNGEMSAKMGYVLATDGMFAFALTWVGGMAGIPRITKTERKGYWAGVIGQGITGPFFVIIGAVMAISMEYVTGEVSTDPTVMLATLASPALAPLSLLLVGFANVGTQATGSYLYAVMLKSSFKDASYRVLVILLGCYVAGIAVWGKIIDYIGVFLTVGACTFGPLASLLLVDFFFVKKQKLSLRAAFEIDGNETFRFFHGINPIGVLCIAFGVAIEFIVYNPVTYVVHIPALYTITPTMCGFIGAGALYYVLNLIPPIRKYNLRDRDQITV